MENKEVSDEYKTPYTIGTSLSVLIVFTLPFVYLFSTRGLDAALPFLALPIVIFIIMGADYFAQRNRSKFNNALRKLGLLPTLTEGGMFVVALTTLALLLTASDLRMELIWLLNSDRSTEGFLLGLFIFIYAMVGLFFSIYQAFSRKNNPGQKSVMKFYAIVTFVGIAISTAVYVYETKQAAFLLFTIWNLIQAGVLLLFSGRIAPGEFLDLPERNARTLELLFGGLIVFLILGLERIIFDAHWAVAFSSVLIIWSMVETYFVKKRKS